MGGSALEIVRAVDYSNAGTVEFLLDAKGKYYFLEMNTRLQVEHGVTELVTGLDLVALQLRIAAGEPLPFTQEEVTRKGHAIECRIYAEDPAAGYVPSAGRLTAFDPPAGDGVRNDLGTYAGDEVSTFYDPMLAKLLTSGAERAQALERMKDALAEYRVEGVKTNLSLLQAVVADPAFRDGDAGIDFLDNLGGELKVPNEALLAVFGALVLGAGAPADPWHASGPWRTGGDTRVQLQQGAGVHTLSGRRTPGSPDTWTVAVGERRLMARFALAQADRMVVETEGRSLPVRVIRMADDIEVVVTGDTYRFSLALQEEQHANIEGQRGKGLIAPMPGLVLRVLVKEGERVRTHQTLVVIEAMKMEHAIEAPHDGTVKKVHCAEGGRVTEGQLLVELEEATPA
jgi:3-methylcrotonyl-CoA carboxylase alpha subunit